MLLNYIDRSYQQIKDTVLTRMGITMPEVTDHNESNPFVALVSIWAGIVEMLGYYADNHATEAHASTANLWLSMVKHAWLNDYRIKSRRAATAIIKFTLNVAAPSPITIPSKTILNTANGVVFETVGDFTIDTGETEIYIPARQTQDVAGITLGNTDGTANQEFFIQDDGVVAGSVSVSISGAPYLNVPTLAYSLPYDTHFIQDCNADRKSVVILGDGYYGNIPLVSKIVVADWLTTLGAAGNVGANTITNIVSTITLPSGVTIAATNPSRASGGKEMQSIDEARRAIQKHIRTLERALSLQDYQDIAELAPSVVNAGAYYTCGQLMYIYIVPDGGGIATNLVVASTQSFIDLRKMVNTDPIVLPAGEVRLLINLTLNVLPTYINSAVATAVKANLVEFLSYRNQTIRGTLEISDLYERIENTAGVRNSRILEMLPIPYARPIGASPLLVWFVTPIGGTAASKWNIVMINATDFQLIKDGNFISTETVGITVVQTEFVFTVTGSYTIGDQWEFWSYPASTNIQLQEASILVALDADITITATGGL
jgi:hypothetical protein